MKVKVLFTGKTTEAWVREGIGQYAARIRHYVSFELVELPDLKQTASLSEEQIKIAASKITLEGIVTANQNFKILMDGSIEAANGKFSGNITGSAISGSSIVVGGANNANGTITVKNSNNQTIGTWSNAGLSVLSGTITGTTITGGTITGSHLYGSYIGSTSDDFYVVEDGSSVEVGVPGFWFGDDTMHSNWIGSITNPATGDDTAGINGGNGYAGFRKLYLLDSWYEGTDGSFWDVDRTLKWLDARLSAIESAGCSSNYCSCDTGEGGGTDGDSSGCSRYGSCSCEGSYDGPVYCDIDNCPSDCGDYCSSDSCSNNHGGCSGDSYCSHSCGDACGPGDGM